MGRRAALLVFALVGLLPATTGCRSHQRTPPPLDRLNPANWIPADAPRLTARPQAPTEPAPPPPISPAAFQTSNLLADPTHPAPVLRRPHHILVLSGGGSYGAFTAGVLNGWSRTGTRPEFDVVTGISTGALIAPLAFSGQKKDHEMRRLYTEIETKDVFRMRSWATLPFRDAAASSAPLRRIVETTMSPEFIAEIGVEHRKGRRLYVGTTNLDARRFTIWDLGAIAARGGDDSRKLIIDVLIASASVPGVFPPVSIEVEVDGKRYTELHVDGGVTAPLFLPMDVLRVAGAKSGTIPTAAPTMYVIVAGKYHEDPAAVQSRVLKVLGAAAGAYFRGHLRSEMANLYHAGKLDSVTYRAAALRQDFTTGLSKLDFDPDEMTKLYAEGIRVGAGGPAWDTTPPERAPGDDATIRVGTKFRTGP